MIEMNNSNAFYYMAYHIAKGLGGDLANLDPRIVHFEFDGGCSLSGYAAEPFEHGTTHKWMSKHVTAFKVSNEYLGSDRGYLQEFAPETANTEDGEWAMSVGEFIELIENDAPDFIAYYERLLETAQEVLDEFEEQAAKALTQGREFARRNGLPFIVKVEGTEHEMHKLHAVDWDASSMFC